MFSCFIKVETHAKVKTVIQRDTYDYFDVCIYVWMLRGNEISLEVIASIKTTLCELYEHINTEMTLQK